MNALHPLAGIGAALLLASANLAAQSSPYSLGLAQTFTHESNLLRLGDGQTAPAGYSRSDTVSSTAVIGAVDQALGRQRLHADLALRSNRLSNNDSYNNQSYALSARLDWETVERFSGRVSLARTRNLASFAGNEGAVVSRRNLETTERAGLVVRRGFAQRLSIEAALDHHSVDYSAPEYARREFRQGSGSLGVRFRPSASLGLGLSVREVRGRYPHASQGLDGTTSADPFRRTSIDLQGDWEASGASRVDLRLSQGRLRYDVSTERNFSGLTGQLGWTWRPSGRLLVQSRFTREPSQDSYFAGSASLPGTVEYSRLTSTAAFDIAYEWSAKVTLRSGLSVSHRSLARTLSFAAFEALPQTRASDRANNWSLGFGWQPIRSTSLGCDYRHESRTGSSLSQATSDEIIGCFAQLMLQ